MAHALSEISKRRSKLEWFILILNFNRPTVVISTTKKKTKTKLHFSRYAELLIHSRYWIVWNSTKNHRTILTLFEYDRCQSLFFSLLICMSFNISWSNTKAIVSSNLTYYCFVSKIESQRELFLYNKSIHIFYSSTMKMGSKWRFLFCSN